MDSTTICRPRHILAAAAMAVAIPAFAFAQAGTTGERQPGQSDRQTVGQQQAGQQGQAGQDRQPGQRDTGSGVADRAREGQGGMDRDRQRIGGGLAGGMQQELPYDDVDKEELKKAQYEYAAKGIAFQMKLDELAVERAENEQVKEFARSNKDRAEQMISQLREKASEKDIDIDSEPSLEDWQEAVVSALEDKDEGVKFDRAYVFQTRTNLFRAELEQSFASAHLEDDEDREGARLAGDRMGQERDDDRQAQQLKQETERELDQVLALFIDPSDRALTAGGEMGGMRQDRDGLRDRMDGMRDRQQQDGDRQGMDRDRQGMDRQQPGQTGQQPGQRQPGMTPGAGGETGQQGQTGASPRQQPGQQGQQPGQQGQQPGQQGQQPGQQGQQPGQPGAGTGTGGAGQPGGSGSGGGSGAGGN